MTSVTVEEVKSTCAELERRTYEREDVSVLAR